MEVFSEAHDPSETKDFAFDWSPKLGDGETVVSQFVTFIDAAGTTNPSNSLASPISRVWISGGMHGQRAIFTISVTTSGGRTLEVALGVNVIDSVLGPAAESEIDRLTRQIAEAEAQRHNVALGNAVVEIWRDGRRITKKIATMAELETYIRDLRAELTSAQISAGIAPTRRRRAIGLAWRN